MQSLAFIIFVSDETSSYSSQVNVGQTWGCQIPLVIHYHTRMECHSGNTICQDIPNKPDKVIHAIHGLEFLLNWILRKRPQQLSADSTEPDVTSYRFIHRHAAVQPIRRVGRPVRAPSVCNIAYQASQVKPRRGGGDVKRSSLSVLRSWCHECKRAPLTMGVS